MGELICKDLKAVKGAFTLEVGTLRIAKGEKIAILGENGCGKTTLLQTLAGVVSAEGDIFHGAARWDRMEPQERALYMAYLPQETEVLFALSVRELAALTLHREKLLQGDQRCAVMNAMEMADFEDRVYSSLSGGEKRRAMLARVFCRESDFIFLDEPTSSLDMRHSALAMRYAVSIDAAVVATIHDLNLAVHYFDRFLLMKHGRILFDKRKQEIDGSELEEVYGIGLARHNDCFVPEW